MSHSTYATMPMYCTVCGRKYDWHAHYGFPRSRTCSTECHREWDWRDVLSIMGKEYYPQPKEQKVGD